MLSTLADIFCGSYSGFVELNKAMVEPYLVYSGGFYKVFIVSKSTSHMFLVGVYESFYQAANAIYHVNEIAKDSFPF